MEYVTVEEARALPGLRLVLTRGVPGPWSEAAKALFRLRNVAYVPVQQLAGDANSDLVEWTRHRNAPIALYENEAPRVRWLELLDLVAVYVNISDIDQVELPLDAVVVGFRLVAPRRRPDL